MSIVHVLHYNIVGPGSEIIGIYTTKGKGLQAGDSWWAHYADKENGLLTLEAWSLDLADGRQYIDDSTIWPRVVNRDSSAEKMRRHRRRPGATADIQPQDNGHFSDDSVLLAGPVGGGD